MSDNYDLIREVKEQQKNHKRWLIIFASIAFAVELVIVGVSLVFIDSDFVLRLQQENASVQRNYDYLQFVVPVLLAMGAFMAAALGINRLKGLDEQIEKIEAKLDKKFDDHERKSDTAINSSISMQMNEKSQNFVNELSETADKKKKEIKDIATESRQSVHDTTNAALGALQQRFSTFENEMQQTKELVEKFNKDYSWLKYDGVIDPDSIVVESVADANAMVENLFRKNDLSKNERFQQIGVIIQKVSSGSIAGDANDYHNLAAELARHELKSLAVQVCSEGLRNFDNDVDLLASIIQYASSIGKNATVRVETYIELLNKIPKVSWTWRCFEFLVDYYLSIKDYSQAKAICEEYTRHLPRDERGYAQLAEVYGYLYSGTEAEDKKIEILEKAVSIGFSCPRCANALANLYADRGELERAIDYSSMAILSLAQPQPSVNYAYVLYYRALYQDRLYLRKKLSGETDCNLRKNALRDYREVIDSNKLSPITHAQAMVRHNLLASDDSEWPKYETANASSPLDLISLLSQLAPDDNSDSEK